MRLGTKGLRRFSLRCSAGRSLRDLGIWRGVETRDSSNGKSESPHVPESPHNPPESYHSNFVPKRASRGGTIVTGSRNVDPELHVMFAEGFAFVRL